MPTYTVEDAAKNILQLLEQVDRGEEVIIVSSKGSAVRVVHCEPMQTASHSDDVDLDTPPSDR